MPRELQKLNDLLGRELGRNLNGEPNYKWIWGPDLTHLRDKGFEFSQRPAGHIYMPERRYEKAASYPNIGKRWVLCKWLVDPMSMAGSWIPTSAILRHGVEPNIEVTQELITRVFYHGSRSATDIEQECVDAIAADEKAAESRNYDMIEDSLTAFGAKPGSRSGGVSFPSPTSSPEPQRTSE